MWKPSIQQMSTAIQIQTRTETNVNGQPDIGFSDYASVFCNWKGRGGTESVQSGVPVVEDTADLTMWYIPGISERDLVLLNHTTPYEITNIENVEMRNQYLILKVRRVVTT